MCYISARHNRRENNPNLSLAKARQTSSPQNRGEDPASAGQPMGVVFPRRLVPMESVSLRSYSDAYPCHRVPTHGLISVIWNKPFFWPVGAPSFACRNFCFPAQQMVILVPMESVSLCSYSDAYPCHRVPTHGLTSVIWNKPFFWPDGAPLSLAVIFVFQLNKW